MQSLQYAHVGKSYQSELEGICDEVRSGVAQPITLQLIFNLGLQQRWVLNLLIVYDRVHIMQMAHSGTVGNGAYSASRAGKRGKPAVQPPATGFFGLAPLLPSCESYAVSDGARDESQNLEACEKNQWDGVAAVKKKTRLVGGRSSGVRRTNTPPTT
jgi:hypothetical protein